LNNKNSYIKEADMQPTVVAIAQDNDQLKAVMLKKNNGLFEIIKTQSSDLSRTNWQTFAEEFIGHVKDDQDNIKLVIGYDSACMIFYHITVPVVKDEKLDALIRLQVEARFPLPVEQMAFAWQIIRKDHKQITVAIAAARKEQLQNFLADVSVLKPAKIILSYEAIAETWKEFFSVRKQDALVLDIGHYRTDVCLVEDDRLSNVTSLDIGTNDFLEDRAGTADRFDQDMRSILENFGFNTSAQLPVYVLSDGRDVINEMASCLNFTGLDVTTILPKTGKLSAPGEIQTSDIYEYRLVIGLAAMAIEPACENINIFEGLYNPKQKASPQLYSPKISAGIAVAMIILLIFVCYFTDVARLKALEKHFTSSKERAGCSILLEQQKIIKEVAIDRPDLLEIFGYLTRDGNNGVLLDTFHYKKGQPVTIAGQVGNDEFLYKFQENLLTKKGLSKVRIQNAKKQEQGEMLNFSIIFDYKNFTKKK